MSQKNGFYNLGVVTLKRWKITGIYTVYCSEIVDYFHNYYYYYYVSTPIGVPTYIYIKYDRATTFIYINIIGTVYPRRIFPVCRLR